MQGGKTHSLPICRQPSESSRRAEIVPVITLALLIGNQSDDGLPIVGTNILNNGEHKGIVVWFNGKNVNFP
jgi:hypothetical protein